MARRITILDNTMREGEQVPGLHLTIAERRQLFDALRDAGVDQIDVGTLGGPSEAAPFFRECVARSNGTGVGVTVRARTPDLEQAAALGFSEVFLMLPFSEIHIEHKFGTTVAEIRQRCVGLLETARKLGLGVNLVAEDASRGGTELVCELADLAARRGARRIFACDTVGAARPERFRTLIAEIVGAVDGRAEVGVHCHNDYGLATANTLAGIAGGARVASVTINGLGERAGNAPLHQVVVGLGHLLDAEQGVDLTALPGLSRMVERMSGVFLSPLEPIVGRNAFRHETGIHVDGLLKLPRIYEELQPEAVGREHEFVLGTCTGIHHLEALLAREGISLERRQLRRLQMLVRREKQRQDKAGIGVLAERIEGFALEQFGFPEARFRELVREVLEGERVIEEEN